MYIYRYIQSICSCYVYFTMAVLPLDVCLVQMVDAQFNYTYEYQGNAPKLVHTPLTDKCYLTLTQAMLMGLGGNPYGPAGTGKTESVKALGGLMGRQVLVFNCDEVRLLYCIIVRPLVVDNLCIKDTD